jgi:activator of HSP90 ATPase
VATPVGKTASSTAAQSLAKLGASTRSANATSHVNTTEVTSSAEFRTTAAELFTTFTDPGRLAAFTRSPPNPFEGARPGGRFGLFGGGVTGEYVSLREPTQIVQKWRLAQWPQGHYTNLTLDFDQDDVDAVTNMRVTFDAVPLGEEDSTKEKWGEYYVRSLKTTFGFGTIL